MKSNKNSIAVGQRWISEMEPELGLGKVTQMDHRRVTIAFHDGETVRIYTKDNAPLRRIRFKPGDTIRANDGLTHHVVSVEESENLITYKAATASICETELSSINKMTAPMDRLLASHVDSNENFKIRSSILDLRNKIANAPVRGFIGGRIELIPHQLYIANEVSSRYIRRIMLADEVGLGKTIEACMILHRLIVSGRASQVLIIVPESMVHVWFVELLRKFNLLFSIIDFSPDEAAELTRNPFSDASLILTGMNLFTQSEVLARYAGDTTWDMVIIDEAHHLVEGTPPFQVVESLSKKTRDLLLLTATPQHFGERNHFARLRLLDPSRYISFEEHCREADEHRKIAEITGKVLDGLELDSEDIDKLQQLLHSERTASLFECADGTSLTQSDKKQIVAELIDRQGIGRALFRNTRAVIGGFPKRQVIINLIESKKDQREVIRDILQEDINKKEIQKKRKLSGDPRVDYLSELLKKYEEEKFLIICRSKFSVLALDEALQKVINVNTALFHEDLTLLQRDRNAAWFSEDEGARILICSEIGSEGRNFQFAHNLFFFDLPTNPELVEQRIGRLDRIGQKSTVSIYIPVLSGTAEAFLARWYHEGLGIFNSTVPAAQEVFEKFEPEIKELITTGYDLANLETRIDTLLQETKRAVSEVSERLKCGRDRLLEQHSFRPKEAEEIVSTIRELDKDRSLKIITKEIFRSRGILAEEFQEDTWKLLSEGQLDESFPGLNESRSIVTFDRYKALKREDYEFLSIDHPAITGGIDLYISSEAGNAALSLFKFSKNTELLMEAVFVTECVAPQSIFVSRFLQPFPLHVIIDNKGKDRTDVMKEHWFEKIENTTSLPLLEKIEIKQKLLPAMMNMAQKIATEKCERIIKNSLHNVKDVIGSEIERLKSLREKNTSISQNEIQVAENEYSLLIDTISKTTAQLDSVRLIWCPGIGKEGSEA